MQPGIDPHTYKAQPHDVELLKKSDLVLYHGLGLEGKMAEVLAQLPNAYAVTDVLKVEDLLCVDEFFRIMIPMFGLIQGCGLMWRMVFWRHWFE